MGPRSVLHPRHVLELEILFRRADDLFRRDYHLLYLGGVGRGKAVGRRLIAFRGALKQTAGFMVLQRLPVKRLVARCLRAKQPRQNPSQARHLLTSERAKPLVMKPATISSPQA